MRIEPMAIGFGAEVHELDVQREIDEDVVAALVEAYARHHLLLFRDCGSLAPERQVEICGWFGPLPEVESLSASKKAARWNVLDNLQPTGSDIIPFHCDISFLPHPFEGLSMHPLALPDSPTSTLFVSNALGWKALPDELRATVKDRRARHFYDDGGQTGHGWPPLEQWHPIRMPHRMTGEPLLYVTEANVDAIAGLDEDESCATLAQLFAVLYAADRRYEHVWKLGDLVIWDNVAMQHCRPCKAPVESGARAFQRVELGTVELNAQIDQARRLYAQVN